MNTLKSDRVTFFDVDETLVTFDRKLADNPYRPFYLKKGNIKVPCWPLEKHIKAMKEHASRGHRIVVWSAGGYQWARKIVAVLKLESIVDIIMCKPTWFYDDKPSSYFMNEKDRVYFYEQH